MDEELEEEEELQAEDERESSLEELIAKKAGESDPDEEPSMLDMPHKEERVRSLNVPTTPPKPYEFVCSNCHLVKQVSQLADRRKKLCRDCV